MPPIVTQGAVVLADGFDLSPYLKKAEPNGEADLKDATMLNAQGQRAFAMGLSQMTVHAEGLFAYDPVTDAKSIDKTYNDAFSPSANKLFLIGTTDSNLGSPALMMNTKQAKLQTTITVGEIQMITLDINATLDPTSNLKPWAHGLWLMDASQTGVINGASVDNTAPSTGYIAQCHVTGAVGLTSLTVKVQHSTDNSTWADLATFTAFTVNGAQQLFNVATSVNRYRRAIVSAFTGTSARVSVGFQSAYAG